MPCKGLCILRSKKRTPRYLAPNHDKLCPRCPVVLEHYFGSHCFCCGSNVRGTAKNKNRTELEEQKKRGYVNSWKIFNGFEFVDARHLSVNK